MTADRQVTTAYQHGSKTLRPGSRLTIKGQRGGVFRFVQHVTVTPADRRRKPHEWIDVIGGARGDEMMRAFRPEQIGRVLR